MAAQAGLSLVEVLVALIILGLGGLGALRCQWQASRAEREADLLGRAVQMATSIAEQIQSLGPAGAAIEVDYDARRDGPPAWPEVSCLSEACSSADMQAWQSAAWRALVHAALPGGRLRICRDHQPWDGHHLRWDCAGSGAPQVVKLGWRPPEDGGADAPPRLAMLVPGGRP